MRSNFISRRPQASSCSQMDENKKVEKDTVTVENQTRLEFWMM